MKRRVLLLAVVFALAASSTSAVAQLPEPPDGPPPPAGDGVAAWTFLVYLAGDNDLEGDAVNDLLEMASVGSDEDVNIVVLVDRSAEYSAAPAANLGDFTSTKLLLVEEGEFTEVVDYGEANTGDPQNLAFFLDTAIGMFPADRYALSLWDHGGGWTSFGYDDSAGTSFDLREIVGGVRAGLEAAGVDRLDLLGFDACLMAAYEVQTALAPYADYFVASEELEPGHGWDYAALQLLRDAPATGPAELGEAIADGFLTQAIAQGTDAAAQRHPRSGPVR